MTYTIIDSQVFFTNYEKATKQVVSWVQNSESRYICAANVHMVMEAWDSREFSIILNEADMVTPDGMPIVWMLRLKGEKNQQRVYGPTLMLHILEMAAQENIPVGFYGGDAKTLEMLVYRMQAQYPGLNVAYSFSPPFRELKPAEDAEIVKHIQQSCVRILFVGLGCPKQEYWMAAHRNHISAVMLGVGAAFDFHAGTVKQSPAWMQRLGLEWFFRFTQEPKRLWKRYFFYNPRFILLALMDLLGALHWIKRSKDA